MHQKEKNNDLPLCVDLDGTLILTDMLAESVLRALRRKPLLIFALPFWLIKGKKFFKAKLAVRSEIAIKSLPYHDEFLAYLQAESQQGRQLVLVTGSHEILAQQVADHIGLFAKVIATDDQSNMVGRTKAARLVDEFGAGNFDYAGNEKKDIHIWRYARKAILVNCRASLTKRVARLADVTVGREFSRHPFSIKTIIKAMRVHQWTKNLLIFVPMLVAHKVLLVGAWQQTVMAYFSFCFMASATYIVNDLCDLDADRNHITKHKRPFASGRLSIFQGLGMMVALAVGAVLFLPFLPWLFAAVFVTYLVGTLVYTFYFKSVAIFDVMILASLFTVRVIAGGAAIGVDLSFWLMSFSIFVFLGLALVKRVSEMNNLSQSNQVQVAGRGYQIGDAPALQTMGVCSSFLAVLVFALYINSPEIVEMYKEPRLLWLICPCLLYWVSHIWLVTARGKMNEDPILYAIKDFKSWASWGVISMAYVAAIVVG